MGTRRRYRSKPDRVVIAVQLDLDFDGFSFQKWGAEQRCKAGDWLVDNAGDVYTVDHEVFVRTYQKVGLGVYAKVTKIWAEVAAEPGAVESLEGETHYKAGDYVVSNQEDGSDAYAISAAKFETLYEIDEETPI